LDRRRCEAVWQSGSEEANTAAASQQQQHQQQQQQQQQQKACMALSTSSSADQQQHHQVRKINLACLCKASSADKIKNEVNEKERRV
jgi:hypothetical protein